MTRPRNTRPHPRSAGRPEPNRPSPTRASRLPEPNRPSPGSGGRPLEPVRPFRWDLRGPDQLGSLLDGRPPPDLPFLDELVTCAAQVLARCGDGDLHFVGRSADSVYDLLSGALSATSWRDRLHLLPYSHRFESDLRPWEVQQLRANLSALGVTPHGLARRKRPIVFTDLVHGGWTFTHLYDDLRGWVDDEREDWHVIRLKLRFLGITARGKTSPNTWRWWQDPSWTADLPRRAIINVSLVPWLWHYFGDRQHKLTPSFRRTRWADDSVARPARDEHTLTALTEAVAIVTRGRTPEVRTALAQRISAERTFSQPWLRTLALELRH
ncbi:hypothetical protein ABT294_45450 [Nonomuraea sp. NPDC000554]|uniref:hypothetical protein n=1 Tax=Nonomuraea sp. NPDC000554 TaxID=3154259 RepID=UPI00332647BA